MTTSKIESLEPGRELAALVAEKVMGQKVSKAAGGTYWAEYIGSNGLTLVRRCPKSYSTDIAAAWEVIEKLKMDGWHIHIDSVGFNNDIEGEWRTFFSLDDENGNRCAHVYADGDTASHAICLAALKAVKSQP